MNKKNKIKAIVAFAVALAFMVPTSAVFVNDNDDTIVSIYPLTQIVEKEQSFTVDVFVEPGEPIAGVQFDLFFDETIIQADLVEEGYLFSGHPTYFSPGTIDNSIGMIEYVYGIITDPTSVTDPGVFVTISFTSLDKFGTSPLDLGGIIKVVDYGGQAVPIIVNDGSVSVGESPEYFDLTISVNGHGTTVPTPGVHTYIANMVVDLEAIHDLGWTFDSWTGPDASEIDDDKITMTKDMFITAYFTEDHYTLTVSTDGNGHVDVVPDKEYYLYGEEPQLTAIADPDWTFDHWSGDIDTTDNPTTIKMDGNKDVTATFTEPPDTIPPNTEIILDGTMGENGWYISIVMVTLNVTDDLSGVESTWYRVYDIYWWLYTGPFPVNREGKHTLEYYSIDHANNIEPTKKAEFKIDTKLPTTTHEFDGIIGEGGWFISNVTVTINAEDVTSGVNSTKYKLDGGEWTNYTNSFVVTENGEYALHYYSVDLAGNIEPENEVEFKILHDIWPPVTEHEFDGIEGDNGWFMSDVVVTLTAEDDSAGVAFTYYKLDDGIDWQKYTNSFLVTEDGDHTITYYSVDKVGNEEDPCDPVEFKIDQTDPTINLTWDGENSKLIANVNDETSGIAKVEFYVAGERVGTVTTAPYEWEVVNPKKGDKGQAIVFDMAGNQKISKEVDGQSQGQDAFIGWTFLIGWISNVEEAENIITAQAIRLCYIEVAPNGISTGFVKMGTVEFSSQFLVRTRTLRSFGRMSMVIGIFKGGITIEGE